MCWAHEPMLQCLLAVGDIEYCTQPEEYAAPDTPNADLPFRLRDNVRRLRRAVVHPKQAPEHSPRSLAAAWLVVTAAVGIVATVAVSAATRHQHQHQHQRLVESRKVGFNKPC